MNRIRWNIFKALSWVGWRICPEPQRSRVWQAWAADETQAKITKEPKA